MIYCFDLDGTLCTDEAGEYQNCKPILGRIAKVRELHAEGNVIIIDTARGWQWLTLTERQLREWNVPHNLLRVGYKPFAHVYVDDKGSTSGDFFGDVN